VRHLGNSFDAEISVPVWTSQLYVNEWWKQAATPLQMSVVSKGQDWVVTVENHLDAKLEPVMVAIKGRLFVLGAFGPGQNRTITVRKQGGEALSGFVQTHGGHFMQVVNTRQAAFGYNEQFSISDVPRSAMAASFISEIEGNPQRHQPQYYGNNFAIVPPNFDLSDLVTRGDAVLVAWAPGYATTKGINQFAAHRGRRDSLLRLASPVQP
jgi:hypothetical protein